MTGTGAPGPTVLYRAAHGVATITLNRPERRNALTRELLTSLTAYLEQAAVDPSVRVVAVTGAGRDFCAGVDLATPPAERFMQREDPEADYARVLTGGRVFTLLRSMPKPSVAVIRGACAGGGLALALACDLRYAADTAVFNSAFLDVGLSGDCGMAWLLSHVTGPARAAELMLLPSRLTAEQAHGKGLLTGLCPDSELEATGTAVTARMARTAPLALSGAVRNLRDAPGRTLEEYLPGETRRVVRSAYSPDAAEARQAYLEKREPRFSGA